MSKTRRSYPRIGDIDRSSRSKSQGTCKCENCGATISPGNAYATVDIQWNYMRGDDDVMVVCNGCSRSQLDVHELIRKLRAMQTSK